MERNARHEFDTFKKCIEEQFGSEMERKILTNFYTNYGDTKNIFEYMFNNLYSEKTTKLVKLNLEIDPIENEENQRKTEARIKNLELKKKIEKLKNKIEKEDLETATLCQNLSDQERRLKKLENDYKNKEISSMAQDVFIKKVQDVCTKFETATRRINFISAESSNDFKDLKQSDLESLISKMTTRDDVNATSLEYSMINSDNKKIKKISLVDLSNYCNKKINEDGEKIEQIVGLKYLNNEVELLLYQLDSKLYNSMDSRRRPNLNILERINEVHIENMRRDCEKKKCIMEKNLITQESKAIKLKLNEYLTGTFQESPLNLCAQYLGSYLNFKRVETEFNEAKAALIYLEKELSSLKEITSTSHQKSRQLKNHMQAISQKQLELEGFLDETSKSLESTLQFNTCQIKSVSEDLLELIINFSSDQLNKTRADSTFQTNNSSNLNQSTLLNTNGLAQTYSQFKAKFQTNTHTYDDEFTPQNKVVFKKLFDYTEFKDQKELFNKFVEIFKKLQAKVLELDKLNRNQSRYQDIQHLGVELRESLDNCQIIDDNELHKYEDLLIQNVKKIKESKPLISEIENLIMIWQTQPGAYECITDDMTVSGKTLGYYQDLLDKIIAQSERMNFAEQEQINEQIRQLLDYCSSVY